MWPFVSLLGSSRYRKWVFVRVTDERGRCCRHCCYSFLSAVWLKSKTDMKKKKKHWKETRASLCVRLCSRRTWLLDFAAFEWSPRSSSRLLQPHWQSSVAFLATDLIRRHRLKQQSQCVNLTLFNGCIFYRPSRFLRCLLKKEKKSEKCWRVSRWEKCYF